MGLSFVPSATAYCLLFPLILNLGFLSCTDRWKVVSAVNASSSSSFKRKSQRTSLLSVVTCCYSKIYFLILRIKSLLQPKHIFRSVMPDHTLSFLNCRSHFSTDVVLTPLVSRLGSSNNKILIGYQITCLFLSFLRLLIRE